MPASFLPGFEGLACKTFGGIRGNAREARPISTKRPMHLTLRSSLARGERSLLRKSLVVQRAVHGIGHRTGVKVYRYANAGNHLHLIILPRSRKAYFAFIRGISGVVARIALGVERGRAKGLKFWDALPYTKIIEWGRQFRRTKDYVALNRWEAEGLVDYAPRRGRRRRPPSASRIRRRAAPGFRQVRRP